MPSGSCSMNTLPTQQDAQPVLHIEINEYMTQQDFRTLCTKINQAYNDRRHEQSMVPGFEPVGLDSEGGGFD